MAGKLACGVGGQTKHNLSNFHLLTLQGREDQHSGVVQSR
jgi:hypothetical protein